MKFNRKGKYVAVQSKLTWVTDNFIYYTSKNLNDWLIIEFDHFFKHNKDLVKTYSSGSNNTQPSTTDTTSITNFQISPINPIIQ